METLQTLTHEKVALVESATAFNADMKALTDNLIIITFYTKTCSVCKAFAPQFAATQQEFKGDAVYFAQINAEELPMIAQQFNIMAVPNTFFIKDQKIIFQMTGDIPRAQLRSLISDTLRKVFGKKSQATQEFDAMFM